MGFSGVLLAMNAVQAISQIGKGYVQQAEDNYNATILQGKADLIDVEKDIEYGKYQRLKGKTASTSYANIAKAGIMPTGSSMASMLNTQTQIEIDQAIGQFNYNQQKNYTLAEADQIRRQGKRNVRMGYTNAFSTMLRGGYDYYQYNKRDKTFDTAPGRWGYGKNTPTGTQNMGNVPRLPKH